jgi:hypothetical protein
VPRGVENHGEIDTFLDQRTGRGGHKPSAAIAMAKSDRLMPAALAVLTPK